MQTLLLCIHGRPCWEHFWCYVIYIFFCASVQCVGMKWLCASTCLPGCNHGKCCAELSNMMIGPITPAMVSRCRILAAAKLVGTERVRGGGCCGSCLAQARGAGETTFQPVLEQQRPPVRPCRAPAGNWNLSLDVIPCLPLDTPLMGADRYPTLPSPGVWGGGPSRSLRSVIRSFPPQAVELEGAAGDPATAAGSAAYCPRKVVSILQACSGGGAAEMG